MGQGDSILIVAPNGKKVLIDAGIHSGKADERNPFTYIRELKKDGKIDSLNIDYAVITHPHDDHYAGFKYLCSKDTGKDDFKIMNIYYSIDAESSAWGGFVSCLDTLNKKAEHYGQISARGPPSFDLGDNVKLTVLYPLTKITTPSKDKNADSIVLKLKYKSVAFLFTGDAPSEVESKILNKDLTSNVLKVCHHGSRSASSTAFLQRVNDDSSEFYAVISTNYHDGKGRAYGYPHKEALDRLLALGDVHLLRTDLNGTIVFSTDGDTLSVQKDKEATEDELWKPGEKLSEK